MMASWTQQQPQHHQGEQQTQSQHHQQARNQQDLPTPQGQNNQMQYQDMNSYLEPQQQQLSTMSPISMMSPLDQNHGIIMSMSPQQQQQPQDPILHQNVGPLMLNQDMCNQSATQNQLHPQQKSHLLPLLLSNRPASLKSIDHNEHATTHQLELDHDQIIEQVISLENEYGDQSSAMTNFDNSAVLMVGHQQQQQQQQQSQQQQQHLGDSSLSNGVDLHDSNQLSSSSEDLLNLLLEIDRDSSNVLSGGVQQLDQDDKVGIETIRKQLMSYDVQSDQLDQIPGGMHSPFDQLNCGSQQQVESNQPSQHNHQVHHGVQQQQLISQTASVIPHQQPQHQLSTPSLMQHRQEQLPHHHRLSVDQTLLHGSYSNTHPGNGVNVSPSIQSYNHQQHQNLARITQSTPMSIDNNSPSPSWQQPQLSPYSPQSEPVRPPSQRHPPLHHPIQPHHLSTSTAATTTTSPPMQQLHHTSSQARNQSQSISPSAKSEPSPVVKKNPLLNAQLVNSPGPSITPTRFISNQTNVLNQNPILNSKLSHGQGSRPRPKQQHQTTSLLKQLLSDDK